MGRVLVALCAFAAALAAAAAPAAAQDRFAVVIGVEGYSGSIGPAPGARADARHVAQALEQESFTVELLEDPDEAALKRSVFWLVDRLNGAGDDAIGIFYFAGHGVQLNGDTFLLPRDARTSDALTLSGSALSAKLVSDRLDELDDVVPIIVIDAAQPNALTARFDLEPGLASIDRPDGGLVIFSDYPDEVALPRQGDVSVFARAFANLAHSEERDFGDAIQAMREEVSEQSGGSRYAWVSGRLSPRFSLRAPAPSAAGGVASRSLGGVADGPQPVPSRSLAQASPPPAAADVTTDENGIHYVTVYFGTDRSYDELDGGACESNRNDDDCIVVFNPAIMSVRAGEANPLVYGSATVSIPPKHVEGQLESPRWWLFEFSPNPERHVVYQGGEQLREDDFFAELQRLVNQSDLKQAFVFIHGFNTSFVDAARRTAQIHHDLNFDGAPIFYSWPSQGSGSPLAYARDGTWAQRTVPHLQQFLTEVAERSGAEKIHLIAHSMGNRALVDALEEMAEDLERDGGRPPFNQVVLSAPDIDREVFLRVADEILPTAQRVTLYASSQDQALKVSRQFNGFPRAGDASDGIVIVDGLNTIDASEVKTELFGFGHDYFATDASILKDMEELFTTNADPDERGLEERFLPPQQDEYWVILRRLFGGD